VPASSSLQSDGAEQTCFSAVGRQARLKGKRAVRLGGRVWALRTPVDVVKLSAANLGEPKHLQRGRVVRLRGSTSPSGLLRIYFETASKMLHIRFRVAVAPSTLG
jgi:hypothetical protein